MENFHFAATAAFGVESSLKREVMRLGAHDILVSDGRVDFFGNGNILAKANIRLRTADRVLLVLGEFKAETFTELFDNVKLLPWGDFIPRDSNFIVTGKSVKSKLASVPDCQSVSEKAIVEKLKQKYNVTWFAKTGIKIKIQIALLRDIVTVSIDTSGAGLHKRGYRPKPAAAPIKETLAAALIDLSFFRHDRVLFDPMCGSGTIAVEAAMIAKNIYPGTLRRFSAEELGIISDDIWKAELDAAKAEVNDLRPEIFASDINPAVIEDAAHNAKRAGVAEFIKFSVKDVFNAVVPAEYGVMITNPPYGERLASADEAAALYSRLGVLFAKDKKWSSYVITSDETFEKFFGRRADAKRKLFNGNIKTDYYQYFGSKPPKV
ncbi:MAG: class I SAM-dependent RNA methyltransferase [Clostridiales bacterium]|nr:class I SAM-dependent RNA methyltransferase [Clostridiales bacterium]